MKPLTTATPHVIIMTGIPGAGKSAFAERFAKTFQAPLVSLSQLMQSAEINTAAGTALSTILLDELLKTQRTLIYDGLMYTKASRLELIRHIIAAGYQPLLVWVQTESVEARRRATKKRPDGTRLTSDEFDAAIKRFTPPTANEKPVVISGKHTYASQLKIVLKRLAGASRPETPELPRSRPSRNIILR
jgi:tRNA uridine 5-carbamoylmethylation protein Kti12